MRSLLAAAALATVCLPSLAAAQPALTTPIGPAPAAAPAVDTRDDLNPTTALALSLGTTVGGYVALAAIDDSGSGAALAFLGLGAVTFGPSVGHIYQGDLWTRGLGVRLAGSAAMLVGLSTIDWLCHEDCDTSDDSFGQMMMIGGLAAFTIGTADDIISAPYAARRRNRERHQRALTLAPRISGKDAGFVVAGTF